MSTPDPVDDRWVLAPGVAVARRPPGEVQVGAGGRALVVSDRPGVRPLLHALAGPGARWRAGEHDALWRRLHERALVVPVAALGADLARAGSGSGAAVAAAYAVHGPAAARVLARRRSVVVGLAGRASWTAALDAVLTTAGLGVHHGAPGAAPRRQRAPRPDVWVLADLPGGDDELLRRDVPHLPLAATATGGVRLGPFTVPGRTACGHCVAAARADGDPLAPLVDLQLAQAAAAPRTGCGDTPHPEDPALLALALGWAAADVVAWADGTHPRTWSATVEVDGSTVPAPLAWPVHPRCGCGWAA